MGGIDDGRFGAKIPQINRTEVAISRVIQLPKVIGKTITFDALQSSGETP